MREAIVILLVIAVLFAFTAIRYRRQIAAFIQFWRMIRSASNGRGDRLPEDRPTNAPLASCPKCGTWVPQDRAIAVGRSFYCSNKCLQEAGTRL